jgi:hypothetical protein
MMCLKTLGMKIAPVVATVLLVGTSCTNSVFADPPPGPCTSGDCGYSGGNSDYPIAPTFFWPTNPAVWIAYRYANNGSTMLASNVGPVTWTNGMQVMASEKKLNSRPSTVTNEVLSLYGTGLSSNRMYQFQISTNLGASWINIGSEQYGPTVPGGRLFAAYTNVSSPYVFGRVVQLPQIIIWSVVETYGPGSYCGGAFNRKASFTKSSGDGWGWIGIPGQNWRITDIDGVLNGISFLNLFISSGCLDHLGGGVYDLDPVDVGFTDKPNRFTAWLNNLTPGQVVRLRLDGFYP